MAVGICLQGHRDAPPGRAIAAIFAMFFVSASFLTIQPHSESSDAGLPAPITDETAVRALDSVDGYFIENRGQVADNVRYYSRGNPSVGLMDDGIMFVLRKETGKPEAYSHSAMNGPASRNIQVESFAYKLRFEGANPVKPVGIDRIPFDSNFFIGNDSDKWRTGVPSYDGVVYRGLYDGIDLVYRQNANYVKYEFVVSPRRDPGVIKMNYEGIDTLRLDHGDVIVRSDAGDIRDTIPYSYEGEGERIGCRFVIYGPATYGFDCDRQDESAQLVIDPLVYSTFLGGSDLDSGWSIAVDFAGNAYATGLTSSVDFPATPGSFDASYNGGGRDRFVAKLNPAGSSLVYCTYLGGNLDEFFAAIAVDSFGNAYLSGSTQSADFPITPGAFDITFNGGYDAYVTKLDGAGSGLVYSTFLGGSIVDAGRAIVLDSSGNAYVAGDTNSTDFPVTPGAYGTSLRGRENIFVSELNPFGSALVYSTYLGGASEDYAPSIALDAAGDVYVAGQTDSPDFPVTPGAFDTSYNGGPIDAAYDVFVTKLNATGTGLVYSTFIGGGGTDSGYSVKVDSTGKAYVTGWTNSINFPVVPGSYRTTLNGSSDAFVAKLNATGGGLIYSTYLGGSGYDKATSLALDSANDAYVTGGTFSADFPVTPGAVDSSYNGFEDVFVAALNVSGNNLAYCTYLGGLDNEKTGSLALDSLDYAYVIGETHSADFPTTAGSFDTTYLTNGDTFVTKIRIPTPVGLPDLAVSPSSIIFVPPGPIVTGSLVTVDATVQNVGKANASQVNVRFYDGLPPSSPQIGTDQLIPSIQRFGGTGIASVTWPAGLPGIHEICVFADPEYVMVEEDETNNIACASLEVLSPPEPDLSVSSSDVFLLPPPPYVEGSLIFVNATVRNIGGTLSSPTAARVHDSLPPSPQIGTDQPLPPIPAGDSANISVTWVASPPGNHEICVVADPDNLVSESNETNNMACAPTEVLTLPDYVLVNTQPASPITVGLSMRIELSLEVLNAGGSVPSSATTIAFFNGTSPSSPLYVWVLPPISAGATIGPYAMDWTSPANPGTYFVTAHVDILDQVDESNETNNLYTWTIEVVAGPITSLVIGNPNYTAIVTYVKSSTPLDFSVVDQSGQRILNTTYRIDGGDWRNYTATGTFFLAGEGQHEIEWYSVDRAGNVEGITATNITVDDTPPATVISPAEDEVESGTSFTLTATDTGCGVNVTMYRVDGGNPVEYAGGFTLAQGVHDIYYYSVDHLGNAEAEKHALVAVNGPSEVAVNYKPIVALVFAIILLVAGVWSSKKRPWKGGKDRVAKAFAFISLPFVLAEAMTGIISLISGELRIPPYFDVGMAVDLVILLVGLGVAVPTVLKARQSKVEISSEPKSQ